jgi:branched-chain amino acid transport system substrate-binding protein
LVRQAFELGSLPINFVYRGGSGAPAGPYLDKIGGFTWQILTRDMENPAEQKVKDFVARYKAFTGKPIASNSYFSLTYYDTMFMLTKAMQAAKSTTDAKAIAAELKKIKYDGVRNMYYDNMGLVHSDLDVGIVKKNGKPYSIPISVK